MRKAKDRLAPATSKLTETIAQIERSLAEQRFGVEGRVPLREHELRADDDSCVGTWVECLAFKKVDKAWRLVIEAGLDDDPESWHDTLLVNASRELRLAAVLLLPALVEELADNVEKTVAEVEAKQVLADRVLASLQQKSEASS